MSFWDNFNSPNTGNSTGGNANSGAAFDEWMQRVMGVVGLVIEGVGTVVGVVRNANGDLVYETDTGETVGVETVAGNPPGTIDTNMLLIIGLAFLLMSRK